MNPDMTDKAAALKFKEEGNALFKAGNFKDAVVSFTKAIECDPTDHVLYSNRSGAYASLKMYTQALDDANACIGIKSDWAKGYSRKGFALINLGEVKKATDAYMAGLKIEPQNKALLEGWMSALTAKPDMGDTLDKAYQVTMDTLGEDPKFMRYMIEEPDFANRVAGLVKDIGEDVNKLQQAVAMSPERVREALTAIYGISSPGGEEKSQPSTSGPAYSENHFSQSTPNDDSAEARAEKLKDQGNAAYKARDFEAALKLYDQALEVNPNEILYLNNKAAAYLEMGNYDLCLAECDKALEKRYEVKADFAKVAKIYCRMAACYTKQGNLEEAVAMYQKALCEDNNRHTRAALRDAERALEKRKTEAFINPELAEEHRLKGNEFFKQQNYPDAKLEYDEAIKRNPKDPKLYGNRCATYMQLFEYPSALKDADKSLELDPKFVKGWARKGNCHLRLKEHNKAIAAYQEGLKIDPEDNECRNGLNQTMMAVRQTCASSNVDEDQVNRAMADPEIQQILRDPQFQLILEQLQQNPQRLPEFLKDSKIAEGLQKLMVAGVLRMS